MSRYAKAALLAERLITAYGATMTLRLQNSAPIVAAEPWNVADTSSSDIQVSCAILPENAKIIAYISPLNVPVDFDDHYQIVQPNGKVWGVMPGTVQRLAPDGSDTVALYQCEVETWQA